MYSSSPFTESNNNENNQSPNGVEDSPRKPKSLWSIADTVGVKADDEGTSGSSKAASTSPAAAEAGAGGQAAVLAAMAAAFQQQFAARQMMQLQMLQATAGGAAAAANPYLLMQAMQARLAAAPGAIGSLAGWFLPTFLQFTSSLISVSQ